ncbi:MAG: proline iminopeptidase-family hydrolase [Gemmatimonadota bacterium]|nr:proline iminopeptidase-family hydrolase [Gemmatimonadota bacterium]
MTTRRGAWIPRRTRTPCRAPSRQQARTPWRAAAIPLVLAACVFAACAEAGRGPAPGEGYVEVEGGRVWYRVVGEGAGTPLLLLHGGPGAPSYYLEPLAALGADRPVVFYDQLGAGRSDRPSDTTLWRVDRFVDELARVRAHLGLDEVHVLGHSWGTMLAVEYMRTDPEGVRSLVLASPALSVRRWTEDADRLLAMLPDSLQEAVETHEAAGTTGDPEYQAAMMEFYRRHLSLADPWPAELLRTFDEFGTEVYEYMWGPSEFTATGTLRSYEREDFLPELDLPVLFTAGRHDEATPEAAAAYRDLVPGARLEIFENSAHMTMLDEPEAYVEAIRAFLADVEAAAP